MSVELATAYVSIVPSMQGVQGQLTRGMGGPAAAAGAASGRKMGGTMAGGVMGAAKRMVPLVAGVFAGVSLARFGREVFTVATGATQTEAALGALYEAAGHGADEAQVATRRLFDEFGRASIPLDAFQGGAEALAYLGLNAEDSVGVLGFLDDAILATGGSQQEMERATIGLTNAMNRGRASNQELQQISGAGIPIYDMLAAQFDTTTDAIFDMAQQGEISVDDLTQAMMDRPGQWAGALSEGADAVRSTLPVAWDAAKNGIVNAIGEHIIPIVNRLAPIVERAADWIITGIEGIGPAFDWLAGLFASDGPGGAIGRWVEDHVGPMLQSFRELFATVWESVQQVWDVIGEPTMTYIGVVWENLKDVAVTVWELIVTVIETAIGIISGIVEFFTAWIQGDWEGMHEALLSIGETIWEGISSVVETVLGFIGRYIERILGLISDTWSSVWGAISDFLTDTWDTITSAVETAVSAVRGAIDDALTTIRGWWDDVWGWVSSFISDTWDEVTSAVSEGVDEVLDWVGSVPDRVREFFTNAKDWLVDAGRNIIQGLIDGIGEMIGNVGRKMGEVASTVTRFLPWSPAKEGPLSGRGYTLYAGRALASDFARGITDRSRLVEVASSDLARAARVGAAAPAMHGGPSRGVGGSGMIHIDHLTVGSRDDADEMVGRLRLMADTYYGW